MNTLTLSSFLTTTTSFVALAPLSSSHHSLAPDLAPPIHSDSSGLPDRSPLPILSVSPSSRMPPLDSRLRASIEPHGRHTATTPMTRLRLHTDAPLLLLAHYLSIPYELTLYKTAESLVESPALSWSIVDWYTEFSPFPLSVGLVRTPHRRRPTGSWGLRNMVVLNPDLRTWRIDLQQPITHSVVADKTLRIVPGEPSGLFTPSMLNFKIFNPSDIGSPLPDQTYYHPNIRNFATFNAFYVDTPGHAIAFQATIAATHEVKQQGLKWLKKHGVDKATYILLTPPIQINDGLSDTKNPRITGVTAGNSADFAEIDKIFHMEFNLAQ